MGPVLAVLGHWALAPYTNPRPTSYVIWRVAWLGAVNQNHE